MAGYGEGIKQLGQEIEYTPKQVKELVNCSKDIFYFLKYVKIIHPDRGRVTFKPWKYQRELFKLIDENRFVIALVARQQGKSIMVAAYLLWYSIFNSDKTVGVISNNEEGSIDILDRIKVMYEELPLWMKPGIAEYNKKTITFENGTKVRARATSKDSFRGRTLNMVFADEFAFVDPPSKCEEFFASNWPTISASKDSKFIIVSTPKGIGNLFHLIYSEAESGINTFKHFRADWTAHPDRNEKWAEEQRKNLGMRRFSQEFGCSFLGSDSTLIEETTLRQLLAQPRIEPIKRLGKNNALRVYKVPEPGAQYIVGVDTGKGTGEHYSAIQVFKVHTVSPMKMEQVAVFEDNHTDVYEFSGIVNRVAITYNNAYVMCENNAEGNTVVTQLWWEYEYENLVNEGTKSTLLGIRATTKTKPAANLMMKKFIEDGSIDIVDYNTIQQFLTFLDLGNNKFGGNGQPDDLISAFYWACYFFSFDILDETFSFKKQAMEVEEGEEDIWGIFGEINPEEEGYEIIKR